MINDTKYTPIIGLEIHLQLNTKAKMFCDCRAKSFEVEPNTNVCPTCLGLPGALPVINKEALLKTIKLGLALGCKVSPDCFFERKNYFYPDLPKGFQITQYRQPVGANGSLLVGEKKVRINRVHLEEDTAKSLHGRNTTQLDFNKSGIPLVEVVSEPDLSSIEEAISYAKKIQELVRWLGVSGADMEKGELRLEPTINLNIGKKATPLVELKNINSFRFAKHALEYEIQRQLEEFEKTGEVKTMGNKTTRGWDEKKKKSFLQRSKEEAHDYRYFPEPDLPPIHFDQSEIDALEKELPQLPEEKLKELVSLGLSEFQARALVKDSSKMELFTSLVEAGEDVSVDEVANWVINKPAELEDLSPTAALGKIKSFGKDLITDRAELEKVVRGVLKDNKGAVEDYKKGKETALQFLLGQVMKETSGKADPKAATKVLRAILKS